MSEVKRYDLCKYQNGYAEMESSVDGEWVDYTDYIKVEQQKAELINILKSIAKMKENDENELNRITKEIIDTIEKYK